MWFDEFWEDKPSKKIFSIRFTQESLEINRKTKSWDADFGEEGI